MRQTVDREAAGAGDEAQGYWPPMSPILWLAISYGLGVWLADLLGLRLIWTAAAWLALAACARLSVERRRDGGDPTEAATGIRFRYRVRQRRATRPLLLAYGATFCLGLTLTALLIARLDGDLLPTFWEQEAQVEGWVVGQVDREPGKESFIMKVTRVRRGTPDGPKSWTTNEYVKVILCPSRYDDPDEGSDGVRRQGGKTAPGLGLGDMVRIEGRVQEPTSFAGDFDYVGYLYHKHVRALVIASTSDLVRLRRNASPVLALAQKVRELFLEQCLRHLRGDQAGLTLGILLGDTSHISENLTESFRLTGLTHILAVSGMNVGWLMAFLVGCLNMLRVEGRLRYLLLAVLVVFYGFVTLCQPSVLRATVMALVAIGAVAFGRQRDAVAALSAGALLLLIYDPFFLFDVGFQLSFGATASLVWLVPALESKLDLRPAWSSMVAMTVAAQLGVAPMLMYYFRQLSLVSLVANVAIVPATAPVLTLGIVATLAGRLWSVLGALGFLPVRVLLTYVIGAAHVASGFPQAALFLDGFPRPALLSYYVFLVLGMRRLSRSTVKIGLARLTAAVLAAGILLALWQITLQRPPPGLRLRFLDVGEGDSTLIQTAEGANVLIDGGPQPLDVTHALGRLGVSRLDAVVITHPHADHATGLVPVVQRIPVGLIISGPKKTGETDGGAGPRQPSQFDKDGLVMGAIEREAKRRRIAWRVWDEGDRVTVGALRLDVLWPRDGGRRPSAAGPSDAPAPEPDEPRPNDSSLVIRMTYGAFSALLPGDVESEPQKEMVEAGAPLSATVLKVPHHGSGRFDKAWFEATGAKLAIISVGPNDYGHPAAATLRALKGMPGCRIMRTDRQGMVTVESDGVALEAYGRR